MYSTEYCDFMHACIIDGGCTRSNYSFLTLLRVIRTKFIISTSHYLMCADKNADKDPAAAEEIFKEVQNAYEILSDQHERAWYDSHRDAILRSDDRHQAGSAGEGLGVRPDDYVDVYAYFTTTCFSGFGDGPRGFYTVYNNLFSALAQQEATAAAARADRRGGSSRERLPSFGLSASPWSEVGAFYAEWSLFATTKDFSWADEYHTATAPNRRVRRAMEQENEKKRKVARKEYNEGVRALIDFVRKRDKRVAAHQVEEAKRRTEREEAQQARYVLCCCFLRRKEEYFIYLLVTFFLEQQRGFFFFYSALVS